MLVNQATDLKRSAPRLTPLNHHPRKTFHYFLSVPKLDRFMLCIALYFHPGVSFFGLSC